MKLSILLSVLLLGLSFYTATISAGGPTRQHYIEEILTNASTAQWQQRRSKRQTGVSLVSFEAVGKSVSLGLDYLMPFLEVPVKRHRNGPPRPLVIINSAAIFSCGLMAAGGLFVGHMLRSLGIGALHAGREEESSNASKETHARSLDDNAAESELEDIFNKFKLIYRNESGERVELTLPSLFSAVDTTFASQHINMDACLQLSVCTLVHNAHHKVHYGDANDMERIIYGLTSWSWLLTWLQAKAPINAAIEAGKMATHATATHCQLKYPHCKWTPPADTLLDLIDKNVKFI